MYKRIHIICEGETEQEFCSNILYKYFIDKQILIYNPIIKKSMGGIVKWQELKKQIEITLKSDRNVFVTTLIDYYGLYKKHSFPDWDIAEKETDKYKRMDILEKAMQNDIDTTLKHRFMPYIQLHEFESLLFNNEKYFYQVIPTEELVDTEELHRTFQQFDNPEMINDNPQTTPSKRLKKIIKGYNKVVYGNILAEEIGLANIREKSKGFNNWIKRIEKF